MAAGSRRLGWRERWANRQNDQRRRNFDVAYAAWQRIDHDAEQMVAAARGFAGLPADQVRPYAQMRRGEVALWVRSGIPMVEPLWSVPLSAAGYAAFTLFPGPAGPLCATKVVDSGVAVVTNQRVLLHGRHRHEWPYAKLIGLAHVADNRTTVMQVSNRVKPSGLVIDLAAAPSFRLNVNLGLADYAGERDLFVAQLERQISEHQQLRPPAPTLVTPELAPVTARFGTASIVGALVAVIILVCGSISLFAPHSASLQDHTADSSATVAAGLPPATTALAAPTSASTTASASATHLRSVPTARPPVSPPSAGRSRIATASPVPEHTSSKPKPKPPKPKPKPTPTPVSLCGAPSNPYGYNYCGRGPLIHHPKPDVCDYFRCIGNFWNGVGYMIECNDGMVSMSGGRQGSCSYHEGNKRAVRDG
jgi:hypothetical protein